MHLLDQRLDLDGLALGRRLLRRAVRQRRLAERDGALERAHQLGREALHLGVGQGRKLVGEKLRRGQQIAQIVIDLGDREAERGEPALLMQHRGELALHGGELFFARCRFRRRGPIRAMMRAGFSGSARNAIMLPVMRRIGRTSR